LEAQVDGEVWHDNTHLENRIVGVETESQLGLGTEAVDTVKIGDPVFGWPVVAGAAVLTVLQGFAVE
jgi:hypothetical protein